MFINCLCVSVFLCPTHTKLMHKHVVRLVFMRLCVRLSETPEPQSVQMTLNGYKCWANLCYIIDEVLRGRMKLLQSQGCFPQLIKAAESCTVSWDKGRPGSCRQYQYFIIFWLVAERRVCRPCRAVPPQHVLLPLQGFSQAVPNIRRVTSFHLLFICWDAAQEFQLCTSRTFFLQLPGK